MRGVGAKRYFDSYRSYAPRQCEDAVCQQIVCAIDTFCCDGWHDGCAELALELCDCMN